MRTEFTDNWITATSSQLSDRVTDISVTNAKELLPHPQNSLTKSLTSLWQLRLNHCHILTGLWLDHWHITTLGRITGMWTTLYKNWQHTITGISVTIQNHWLSPHPSNGSQDHWHISSQLPTESPAHPLNCRQNHWHISVNPPANVSLQHLTLSSQ